jgi:hypothetical protein
MPDICLTGYLYRNSDNAVEFLGATDIASGEYVNHATMQVWLYTQSGVPVAGESWPLSGSYVLDSNGDYIAILQDTIDWSMDSIYKLVLEINGGSNLKKTIVEYRELIDESFPRHRRL